MSAALSSESWRGLAGVTAGMTDAVVEMFDALVGRVFSRSDDDLAEARLDQADAQAEGARLFREVVEIVLDSAIPAEAVRAEGFRRIPWSGSTSWCARVWRAT